MQVAFFGTSDFAVPLLKALTESGATVRPVVTAPPKPSGRGRRLVPSPVQAAAVKLGLEFLATERPNDPGFAAKLSEYKPDAGVLAAYGYILCSRLLKLPRLGFINIHPSLLPAYRGAAPIQRALMAGESRSGVSIIRMARQVDAGNILSQQAVHVGPDETAGELSLRLAALGTQMLLDMLGRLGSGPLPGTPQDQGMATTAPKLTSEDRRIDWASPAREIHNRVRALSPEPGAVALFRSKRLVVLRSRVLDLEAAGPPGSLRLDLPGLAVTAQLGTLELLEVRPESGRTQTGQAFRNGHRPGPDDRLASL